MAVTPIWGQLGVVGGVTGSVGATTRGAVGESAGVAVGFHDDMEFMTALHAAHDLNIPFEQLKAETTGKKRVSLDAAVRKHDRATERGQTKRTGGSERRDFTAGCDGEATRDQNGVAEAFGPFLTLGSGAANAAALVGPDASGVEAFGRWKDSIQCGQHCVVDYQKLNRILSRFQS